MNNNPIARGTDRIQLTAAVLVFLLPFLVLITNFAAGLDSLVFLAASLFVLKEGRVALMRHWPAVRWVVLAFALNFLCALGGYLSHADTPLGALERPVRMLLGVSAMLLVLVARPDRKVLWSGVIGGAVAGAVLVTYQRWDLGVDRPGGLINAITFGDISLCMGLLALGAAIDLRGTRHAPWAAVGALAGLIGSITTGSRGGWIALVFAAVVFVKYSHVMSGKLVRALVVLCFALVAATYFVPEMGVRERVAEGVSDVDEYFNGGSAFSHLGIRFELWKGAAKLIDQAPLFGHGTEGYKHEMRKLVDQGKVDPVVLSAPHIHNDALQVLVTYGLTGFLAWVSTLIAPFLFFVRTLDGPAEASRQRVGLALAGMLLVVSYASFGLTEVIFWSIKGSLFYALTVFLLMGFSLNAKDGNG